MKAIKNTEKSKLHSQASGGKTVSDSASKTGNKSSLLIAGIASLAVLTIGAVVLSPENGILSKFTTGTQITSKNAALQWSGGSDNTFRSKLSATYVTQLDSLTLAILRKGVSMTDAQFSTYLTNLSVGMTALGSRAPYSTDTDVQNILGFLVYEVRSTITAMSSTSTATSAISELANLINNTTGTSTSTTTTPDARVQVKSFIQANIADVDYILTAMLITKTDPTLVASVAQELGYRDITEQMVVDHTNANISKYLADTDGKLRAKGAVLTQAHLDTFKGTYGNGNSVVAIANERSATGGSTNAPNTQVSSVTPAKKLTLDDFEAKCEIMEPNPKYTTKYGSTTVYPANRYIYSSKQNCPELTEVSGNEVGSKGTVIKRIVVVPKSTTNFKITPQKDVDGYWQNATLDQWESIYSLVEDIISKPTDLDKVQKTNGSSGYDYDLVVRLPNAGYDKARLFRGITLSFACDNAECVLQSISDNSNYDKALVGKAKYFIPRDLPVHIVGGEYQGGTYRGYWSVASFGKKPEYSIYKTSGELNASYWKTETVFPSIFDTMLLSSSSKTQAKVIASGITFGNSGMGCVSGYNCGGAGILDIFYGDGSGRQFHGFVPVQAGYLYQDVGVTPELLNHSKGRHTAELNNTFINPLGSPSKDPEGVGGALNHDWTTSVRLYWTQEYNRTNASLSDKNAFVLPKIKQAITDLQAMRSLGSNVSKTPNSLVTQDNSPAITPQDGQCAPSFNSYEATPKCSSGLSTAVSVNGSTYTWGCKGLFGGKDTAPSACSARIVPVEYTWVGVEWSACMPAGFDANGKLQGSQRRYSYCVIKSPDTSHFNSYVGEANTILCSPLADSESRERVCSLN